MIGSAETLQSSIKSSLQFTHLPAYADFLLSEKLDAYVTEGIRLSKEVDLPILRYFSSLTYEQLYLQSKQSTTLFLHAMMENKLYDHFVENMQKWQTGQLQIIERDQLVAEDITTATYIRKKLLTQFIADYTSDIQLAFALVEELDNLFYHSELAAFRIYIDIQNEKITEQIRSTEQINKQLNASTELFKQAQALTHIGNWTWDIVSDTVEWSDEMYRIYGLEPQSERITFEDFLSIVHVDDKEMVERQMRIAFEKHAFPDFYHRIILPDGSEKILHAKGEVITDKTGAIARMMGTGQDVTKQKLMENAILENQRFVQKITRVSPLLLAVYNINNGKYLFINESIQQLLGYTSEQVLKEGIGFFMSIIHPDDMALIMEKNNEALARANEQNRHAEEEIVEFKYRLRHKNGEYRWVHTYGTVFDRNKNGQVEHVINASVDITSEHQLQQQLENEKAFAELLVESSPYLILTYDTNFRINTWNKKSELHTGISKADAIGRNILELFPEYNNDEWKNQIKKVFDGEYIHYPKVKFRHGNGYGESFVIPLKDASQEVIGLLSITNNITNIVETSELLELKNNELEVTKSELERMNTELRKSEELHHKMVTEIGNYAIFMIDKNGFIETWNKGAEHIKGYKAEEVIGKNFSIFYTAEDLRDNMPEQLLERAKRSGKAEHEGWRVKKDGSRFWCMVTITALYNDDREIIGFSKVTRDLTEAKKAENQLKNYAKQLEEKNEELHHINQDLELAREQLADDRTRLLVSAMPQIVGITNQIGALEFINDMMHNYTGAAYDDLKEFGWLNYVHEEDKPQLTSSLKKSVSQTKTFIGEFRLRRADGNYLWHRITVKPLATNTGESNECIAIMHNIHEQKMNDAKKDEFMGIASHELKTPLTSIKAYIQLLRESIEQGKIDDAGFLVKKADQSINKLNELVVELLDMTTIQHGKLKLNIATFDLSEMINNTIELIQPSIKHQIINNNNTPYLIEGDSERLQQVLFNLISNAVKYSPGAQQVNIDISPSGEYMQVAVKDHGIGIPKSDIEKIFSRFYRVEGNAHQFQGLGIGLFISAEIIKRHQGSIWVESEPGKGSTFYFKIPVKSLQ